MKPWLDRFVRASLPLLGFSFGVFRIVASVNERSTDVVSELNALAPYNQRLTIELIWPSASASKTSIPPQNLEAMRGRYSVLVERWPSCDVCWHNKAWIDAFQGRNSEALFSIDRAVRLAPEDSLFHLSYGLIANKAGVDKLAVEQFSEAIKLQPALILSPLVRRIAVRAPWLVQISLGQVYPELSVSSDPLELARRGQFRLLTGHVEESKKDLLKSSEILPSLPTVWQELAYISRLQQNMQAWRLYSERCIWLRGGRSEGDLDVCDQDQRGELQLHVKPLNRAQVLYATRVNSPFYLLPREFVMELLSGQE